MPKTATAIAITTGLPILGFEFLLIECSNPDDCSRQINRNGGEGSLQGGARLPAMTAIHEPSLQEQFFALPVAGSSTKELNNGYGNKRNRFPYRQRQGGGNCSVRRQRYQDRIDRARHDRQDERQSLVRRVELWRISRDRRRPLSATLAVAEIRYQPWRLSHRHHRDATQGSAEIRQRQCLELERP